MEPKISPAEIAQTLKQLETDNRLDIISEIYEAVYSDLQIKQNLCLRKWLETPEVPAEAISEIHAINLCDQNGIIHEDIAIIIKSCFNDITCKSRYPLWYVLLHPVPWPLVK